MSASWSIYIYSWPTNNLAWAVLNMEVSSLFCFSVCSSQDIFKQASEDHVTSANELPYFEGDFWPNVLEESIRELEQEEEDRKKEENTATCETPEVRTRRGPGCKQRWPLLSQLSCIKHDGGDLGAEAFSCVHLEWDRTFPLPVLILRAHRPTAKMARRRTARRPIRIRVA